MKKILFILAAILLIGAISAQQARMADDAVKSSRNMVLDHSKYSPSNRAVIYSEGFETTNIEQIPTGWQKSSNGTYAFIVCNDQNNYPSTNPPGPGNIPGVVNIVLPFAGTKFLAQGWNDSGKGNWVISSGFPLTAGVTYTISFQLVMPGYNSPNETNSFECRIGDTPTAAALATAHQLYTITQKIATWTLVSKTFTPTTSGTFYLYFKDSTPLVSGGYGIYIAIDDLKVEGDSGPTNVTITTAVTPTGAGTVAGGGTFAVGDPVTLTATANTGYTFEKWNTGSTANPLTFNASVNATYTAHFISDNPGDCDPATNLNVVYAGDCSKATLTWGEPAKKRVVILSEGFESGSQPAGWQFIKTGSGEPWLVVDLLVDESGNPMVFPHSGDFFATNLWNGAGPRNAWMMSKGFTLTAGKEYTITWWLGMQGYMSERDKLKVCIGNAQTAAAMEAGTEIYRNESTAVTNWTKMEFKHTPTASGTFYLGFHAYSASNMGNDIDIDDVEIYEEDAPPTPFDFNVYRDGAVIASEINALTFEDTTFDPTVGHTWEVKVVCSGGDLSDPISKTLEACSPPLPPCEPVTEFEGEYSEGVITLTWEAPATLTPEKYEIFKDDVSAGFVNETTYTKDVSDLDPGEYEYNYCVVPVYATGVCEGDIEKPCAEIKFEILSIKENAKTSFSVVPNPASNNITIKAANIFHTVEIVSFLGQTIYTQPNTGSSVTLDISNYSNGVYFVRIISENGTSVKKFVKQ